VVGLARVAVAAVIAEVVSLQFVLLMMGVGAVAASGAAALDFSWPVQVSVSRCGGDHSCVLSLFGRPRLCLDTSLGPPAATTKHPSP